MHFPNLRQPLWYACARRSVSSSPAVKLQPTTDLTSESQRRSRNPHENDWLDFTTMHQGHGTLNTASSNQHVNNRANAPTPPWRQHNPELYQQQAPIPRRLSVGVYKRRWSNRDREFLCKARGDISLASNALAPIDLGVETAAAGFVFWDPFNKGSRGRIFYWPEKSSAAETQVPR